MKRVGNPLITSRKLERNVRYNVIAPQGPPKFTLFTQQSQIALRKVKPETRRRCTLPTELCLTDSLIYAYVTKIKVCSFTSTSPLYSGFSFKVKYSPLYIITLTTINKKTLTIYNSGSNWV